MLGQILQLEFLVFFLLVGSCDRFRELQLLIFVSEGYGQALTFEIFELFDGADG